jgi:hypothetical protein
MTFYLRAPLTTEQLIVDAHEKLEEEAKKRQTKEVEILVKTELFLDMAERLVALEQEVNALRDGRK